MEGQEAKKRKHELTTENSGPGKILGTPRRNWRKECENMKKERDAVAKERDNLLELTAKLTKERDELRAREEEMVTLSECEKFMTDILPVCPVTSEIAYRPVVTNTNVTLDQPSYARLLAQGKTCPVTRQPLTSSTPAGGLQKVIYNLHLQKIKRKNHGLVYVMPPEKRASYFVRLSMESKGGFGGIDKGEVKRHADEAMAEYKAIAESKNTNVDVGLCQMHKLSHIDFDGLDNDMMTLIQKALDAKRRENEKRDRELEEEQNDLLMEGMTDDDDFEPEPALIPTGPLDPPYSPRSPPYAGPQRVHPSELHPRAASSRYTPPVSPSHEAYAPPDRPPTPGYHPPYSPVSPTDSPMRHDGGYNFTGE